MATQVKNLNLQWWIWTLEVAWIWAKLVDGGFGPNLHRWIWAKLVLVITVKLMVRMKNLVRLKDGQGPCLDNVSVEQHLHFYGELQYQIRYLYSGLEAIKASEEWGVPLSWCHIIAETTSPVWEKNKKRSWPLQPILNSKHSSFPAKRSAAQWNRSHLWDGISQKTYARGFRAWM